jgi:hypothetical protein
MPHHGHFTPRNDPVPTVQEAEWSPWPVSINAGNNKLISKAYDTTFFGSLCRQCTVLENI